MLNWLRRRRDRLLGRADVRETLASLPLGRMIADRHGERLFALLTGFAQSRMLAAAVELGLFERLAARPAPIAALADAGALPPDGMRALADSMCAAGLWEMRSGNKIGLTVDGLVVASEPGVAAMIGHNRLLYDDLADPVAMLRAPGSGRLARFWPYRGGGDAGGYAALMAASQAFSGDVLARSYDFGRHRRVMDIGGGDGRFLRTLAGRWPRLALALVDLPPVVAAAAPALAAAGIESFSRLPGETLPAGADAITMLRLLHDLDDDAATALLGNAARALPPGGALIVAEPMRRRGRDPVTAYFAAYFAAMGSGRLRSPAEIRALLQRAGLAPARHIRSAGFLLRFAIAKRVTKG